MRCSPISREHLGYAMADAACHDWPYCPSFAMATWMHDCRYEEFKLNEQEREGLFHSALKRWIDAYGYMDLKHIIDNSDLKAWIEVGLSSKVLMTTLGLIVKQRRYELGPYMMLLRYLYHCEIVAGLEETKGATKYRRFHNFWVDPNTGWGPVDPTKIHQSQEFRERALYPNGCRTLQIFSFIPTGMQCPIMIPFHEPAEVVGRHVLVQVTDLDKFIPFINSKWLDAI